jgi:FkbM family methyltransferase
VLNARREHFGDGVVALDCGANIGALTVKWAKAMAGWGGVMAIEPQERIYYALCGNIVINNCFNAFAVHAALGAETGTLAIPVPNYLAPGSFGSLELRSSKTNENIGQAIDYDKLVPVQLLTIDKLDFSRMDFIKIDVEGMEQEVLAGAKETLERSHPIIMIEHIKSKKESLIEVLSGYGYVVYELGLMNYLAIHADDPTRSLVK